jgi:beta-lactamase class D
MRFRMWRSKSILVAVMGCVALLGMLSLGTIHGMAQSIAQPAVVAQNPSTQTPDFGRHFREMGVEGSILIYDSKNDRTYEHNRERNATPITPASTFKIFNAMVALETGIIPDDVAILTWDGVQREVEAWNHDTNLRQGFKNSTIWFYQVLARKAGHERMQQWIDRVGYGNRQIGAAEDIDHFWLDGPLQTTPKQQVEFLQRLYRNELPFSARTMDLVKDIMIFEQTPDYVLRAKTGWLRSTSPEQGWFVGYVEQNDNVYFFATNIDLKSAEDAPDRIEITRRCFNDLGLL